MKPEEFKNGEKLLDYSKMLQKCWLKTELFNIMKKVKGKKTINIPKYIQLACLAQK